jgi:exopolyphosphatase / guanosine-5'-triphosphate,3'-diphosphate pyrophosphatase
VLSQRKKRSQNRSRNVAKNLRQTLVHKRAQSRNQLHFGIFTMGIIDLGTNSVRLDIYEIKGHKVTRVLRERKMIRLGDGVYTHGKITPAVMSRAMKALLSFRKILNQYPVNHVVSVGTSAVRTAKNTKVFLTKVYDQTGINVRVITGREEGLLIAQGILSNVKTPKGNYALVDIGGGSTEISICRGKKVLHTLSLPLGANRLNQIFLHSVPPIQKRGRPHPVLLMRQYIKNELMTFSKRVAKYKIEGVIGSSGTIKTISKILKPKNSNGKPVSRKWLVYLNAEMQTMTRSEIMRIKNIEPKRIDMLLAGSILFEEILYALDSKVFWATDFALREGLLIREIQKLKSALHN